MLGVLVPGPGTAELRIPAMNPEQAHKNEPYMPQTPNETPNPKPTTLLWGLGFRVWGLGFEVWVLVWGFGFGV